MTGDLEPMPKISLSSIAIVAARVLLLCLAGGAVVTALFIAKRERAHGVDPGGAYLCPMHPEVSSVAHGDCPICGMALEVRKPSSGPPGSAGGTGAASFQLPQAAAIATFDEVGYGKMFEMPREMRAPAWGETPEMGLAVFYKDEVALLRSSEEAMFFPSSQAGEGAVAMKVRRIDEPAMAWDRATAVVRFRPSGKARLVPGQTGSLKFAARIESTLAVRASAIFPSPKGPMVFLLAKDNRTLTRRPVEIGSVRAGHAAVISGLAVGERVAALGTFFLDAEQRLSGAAP